MLKEKLTLFFVITSIGAATFPALVGGYHAQNAWKAAFVGGSLGSVLATAVIVPKRED